MFLYPKNTIRNHHRIWKLSDWTMTHLSWRSRCFSHLWTCSNANSVQLKLKERNKQVRQAGLKENNNSKNRKFIGHLNKIILKISVVVVTVYSFLSIYRNKASTFTASLRTCRFTASWSKQSSECLSLNGTKDSPNDDGQKFIQGFMHLWDQFIGWEHISWLSFPLKL